MIEMIKNSAISFHIKVDIHGIKQMLSYIEENDNNGKGHLKLIYLGKNRRLEIELNYQEYRIIITEDTIKICMDDEEIDYLKQRLEEALISKSFYPSEICERNYKNRSITLYCDVM